MDFDDPKSRVIPSSLMVLLLKLMLKILKLKFGQNIEAEVLKSFLSSVFLQTLSRRFGQVFEVEVSRDFEGGVWLIF